MKFIIGMETTRIITSLICELSASHATRNSLKDRGGVELSNLGFKRQSMKQSIREAKPLLYTQFPLPYQREGDNKGEGYLNKKL